MLDIKEEKKMTVKELLEDLEKVQNKNANIFTMNGDGNVLKYDGYGITKVVEVICKEDSEVNGVYFVSE